MIWLRAVNLNIYGDRRQKRFLYGLINNPVLGSILIEFNFSQQDNVFMILIHVIDEFYVSGINIYYRKILLKKLIKILFANLRPKNFSNKLS